MLHCMGLAHACLAVSIAWQHYRTRVSCHRIAILGLFALQLMPLRVAHCFIARKLASLLLPRVIAVIVLHRLPC